MPENRRILCVKTRRILRTWHEDFCKEERKRYVAHRERAIEQCSFGELCRGSGSMFQEDFGRSLARPSALALRFFQEPFFVAHTAI